MAEGAATAGDDAAFLLPTAWKAPPWLVVGLTALAAGAFGLAHA